MTTLDNQISFGRAPETLGAADPGSTYTMGGITSDLSRARQSGPLELVTSDSAGNLATDGGEIFSRLSSAEDQIEENTEGVAMALALQTPWVPPTQSFALSGGAGAYEGEHAIALGAAFRVDPHIQVEGGVGYGLGEQTIGGRVGMTVSW